MTTARWLTGLVAVLVVASGCARDEDAEPPTPSDPSSTVTPSPTATPTPAEGQDASGDLSDFVCAPDGSGSWNASGVLTPSAASPGDYAVTVVVAGPDESTAPGRRRVLAGLRPSTPVPFEILQISPVGSADLTCQVKVLRLD